MKQKDERSEKIDALMEELWKKQEAENKRLEEKYGKIRNLPRFALPRGWLAVAQIAYIPLLVGSIFALGSGMQTLAMCLTVAMLASLAVIGASGAESGGSGIDNFPEGRP